MTVEGEGTVGDVTPETSGEGGYDPSVGEASNEGSPTEEVEIPEWQKAMHKLSIDGEEVEVSWDELTKGYQRAGAANRRFMEAKKLRDEIDADREQIRQIFEIARNDPDRLLRELGVDALSYAEQRILKEIEEEKKPQEQREAERWKTEAQKAREEAEKYRREQEERIQAAETEKWVGTFNKMIDDTLQKVGLPKNAFYVGRVGKLIETAIANGMDADVEEMAAALKEEFSVESRAAYGSLPAEELAKMLGEDKIKELREWDVGRLRSERSQGGYRPNTGRTEPDTHVEKNMSFADYMAEVKKKHGMAG